MLRRLTILAALLAAFTSALAVSSHHANAGGDRSRGWHRGDHTAPPILRVDFTTTTPGALAALPGGLLFTRASAATVQTGTSTVVTAGIGTDVARVGRRLDADSVGLVIEPSRTNRLTYDSDYSNAFWSKGTGATLTAGQADPAGGTGASRVQATSGNWGISEQTAVVIGGTAPVVESGWFAATGGTETPNANIYQSAAPGRLATSASVTTAWNHVWLTSAYGAGNQVAYGGVDGRNWSAIGGVAAGARDCREWGAQAERGAWPSELIQTSGASATRAGERLYRPTASALVHYGRLSMALSFRPKSTLANADGVQRLWTSGADYAELATTGVLTVSVGGVTNTTAALSWAQYDSVRLFVAAGGGVASVVSYNVNAGAVVHPAVAGAALGTVSTAGALELLNDGAGTPAKQLACWLTAITFYKASDKPAWA